MGASAATALPTPKQIVSGLAKATPAELSTSPLLGILGVIMGAAIVTLAGRLLTLGLADLKGHVGIGFDEGAWIGSAFNIALMFIGPFTVYLGALAGPRKVLLIAAAAFTAISLVSPLIHSYGLMIAALAVAGLTSGTFYPLTMSFALRNIPPRYLPYTLALYATFVDMGVNIAPTLYGWYRDHLSWQWMFWTSAVVTPLMMVCIYFGIPKSPERKKSGEAPSFVGFLSGSAGLAMLYAVMDQGERLDWWHSGTIMGLTLGGSFLLLFALLRRLLGPNPLVDLPYLRQWNTRLLGVALIFFRFCLLGTIILIPQSLAIHGFEADQIGPAVFWTAAFQLLVALLAAVLLLWGLDSRLLMAMGFLCMGLAGVLNAGLTGDWAAPNYYRTELLMAVGQSFAFVGLVSTIVLQAIFSGGLAKAQWVLTFSAFFHVVRLFGGEFGVACMTHFIAQREKLHSNLLGLHIQMGNWAVGSNVQMMAAGLYPKSSGWFAAAGRGIAIIGGRLRLQAYVLTMIDGFHLLAWACIVALIIVAALRPAPLSYDELGTPQEPVPALREAQA